MKTAVGTVDFSMAAKAERSQGIAFTLVDFDIIDVKNIIILINSRMSRFVVFEILYRSYTELLHYLHYDKICPPFFKHKLLSRFSISTKTDYIVLQNLLT